MEKGIDNNDWEIYYYNISTNITAQLTNNTTGDGASEIDGNRVVWNGYDGNDYEIYYYDGNRTRQLTNNATGDYYPDISGSRIVWQVYDGSDSEIYYYDGNSTRQLTNNATDDIGSYIDGNRVVWNGYDGNDYEIYYYDLARNTTAQLTNNATDDYEPAISGNRVVWEGYDGSDWEIYLAVINDNPPPPPPTLRVGFSQTSITTTEGNSGIRNLSIPVSLSTRSQQTVQVGYRTLNGAAQSNQDFRPATGTLRFSPNQTRQNITVGILGDLAVENNESFTLELFSPRNASLGTSRMTINLTNEDRPSRSSEILSKDLIALQDKVIPTVSEFNGDLIALQDKVIPAVSEFNGVDFFSPV